jgi:hypothetical protein
MFRNFIPFILAAIGLPIIFFNFIDPLFEWQISKVVMDFPSVYIADVSPSPWKARFGDSLNDKSFVSQKIWIWENGKTCSTRDLNFVVKRSQSDELLERLSLLPHLNDDTIDWVLWCVLIEIALSWLFAIGYTPRSVFPFKVLTTLCFCIITALTIRVIGPRIGSFDGPSACHGTIIFSAKLLKVYYSVPVLLLTGILAELAALTMMAFQVIMTVSKRRESSRSAAG